MTGSMRTAFAGTLLLFSQSAIAQEPPPAPETSDIVVTADRDIDRRLKDFVGALAPAQASGQLGRFEQAVCPAVLGLSAGNKAAIERRLRSVAKAAGLDVAPEGCSANVLVMVTENKRTFIEALQNGHRRFLGNLTVAQTRRLARDPGPTAAWQMTSSVTARGTPIASDVGGCESCFLNRTTESPSRITAPTRPVFEASALVVERRALSGLTTTQLADYAAMRLLAKTDPARLAGSAAPTIVTILDAPMGSEVPITLTKWDLGFLRGLYASPNNVYSGSQRSEMARQIGREIGGAEEKRD